MANSDIKVTNLEYYKVGTGDCEVYLGTVKLYPLGTPPTPPSYDAQYLTIRATSNGTLQWSGSTTANTLSYSTNSGSTWSTPSSSVSLNVNNGDTIMWKGECAPVANSGIGIFKSTITPAYLSFDVEGNPMSLIYGDNFSGQTSLGGYDYAFTSLFANCRNLTSAENLSLGATTLSTKCYQGMFNGCTSLTSVPALPATTLANNCYQVMFYQCSGLTEAPELPATTLVSYCYQGMFMGCTNLSAITCLATDISASNCTTSWVQNVAPSGVFTKDPYMTDWSIDSVNGIPVGWTAKGAYDTKYLTIRVTSGGTLQWSGSTTANTLSYSTDSGSTWSTPSNYITINANSGDTILLKGQCVPNSRGIGKFSGTTAQFDVEGNIMSLLYGDNFRGQTSLASYNHAFDSLFQTCTTLINAENLSLPATELGDRCYASMFNVCTELLTAPELPATTLADACYTSMFATCQSLVSAPELPATTLVQYCYSGMFLGCALLTTAPTLSATTLAKYCYQFMFNGCRNLNSITCLATNISASQCTNQWVWNVSSAGTFTKAASMTDWTTGDGGIPSNWTVQDYNP